MTKAFKVGDKDPYISKIQLALNYKLGGEGPTTMPDKAYLTGDGDFGPKSRNALMAYQKTLGLPQTGVYDDKTAAVLDPYIAAHFVTIEDMKTAAQKLQVELACVRAVTEVESKGAGFFGNGAPKILFERHVFRQQLLKQMKQSAQVAIYVSQKIGLAVPATGPDMIMIDDTMQRTNGDIYNQETGGYKGDIAEYVRLAKAKAFNDVAALCSASWGMFQIMGYHYPKLGYKTVQEMVTANQATEKNHLTDFINFIQADPNLTLALRSKDFLRFARGYNGPAQKGYDEKMQKAYNLYKVV